jgi:hypothetical protein
MAPSQSVSAGLKLLHCCGEKTDTAGRSICPLARTGARRRASGRRGREARDSEERRGISA